jgi:copper chaperone CopZ
MFTVIDAIPGFATFDDQYTLDKYNQAKTTYEQLSTEYRSLVSKYGAGSAQSIAKKVDLDEAAKNVSYYENLVNEQKKDDNTVYLFLVPDVNKRIQSGENYYTCSQSTFKLSDGEKRAILDLIEESGQRILTVDNAILNLQYPKFSLNMSLILWEGTTYDNIRQTIISKTSDYFLKNTRRDRIPVSDLIKVIEDIDGVDSVNVWFDADADNLTQVYGTHYGIDNYGDIILERYVKDAFGNNVAIKDVYPLIRGGFFNAQETWYEDSLEKSKLSTLNIQVRGYTQKNLNSENNVAIMSSL